MTNLDEYWKQREQLILEDRALRVDASTLQNLSTLEADADRIVRTIRAAEAKSVWGAESQTIFEYKPDDTTPHIFPGMAFLTARETVVQTSLFKILSKMPKGGLLHIHLDASVNIRVLLQLALAQPAMHICTSIPLTSQSTSLSSILPQFAALPPAEYSSLASLTDFSYPAGSWVPLAQTRANFAQELGGPEGFDRWIERALTIDPGEAYGTCDTTTKIWAKFSNTFVTVGPLVHFTPVYREYIRQFFLSSTEDGILYVEPRINFMHKFMVGPDGIKNVPHREWLKIFENVLHEVREELKARGRGDEFFDAKIIYTTIRMFTPTEMEWYLEDCLALAQEFPHLIAGFDLVGHEDSLLPLTHYLAPLRAFQERQKELGIDIPFIFHAGETLGDGNFPDCNLYDAVLLGTKRIGHGFSLVKHPRIMQICREKGIAIEVCPISNEILRLTSSMPTHPLPVLVNHGVHVALCSDDPAVFGSMGLSFDFFQVLVASEVNGLITMGEFAKDSIKFSMLSEEKKARALACWEAQWQQFLQWVVSEYGSAESA